MSFFSLHLSQAVVLCLRAGNELSSDGVRLGGAGLEEDAKWSDSSLLSPGAEAIDRGGRGRCDSDMNVKSRTGKQGGYYGRREKRTPVCPDITPQTPKSPRPKHYVKKHQKLLAPTWTSIRAGYQSAPNLCSTTSLRWIVSGLSSPPVMGLCLLTIISDRHCRLGTDQSHSPILGETTPFFRLAF